MKPQSVYTVVKVSEKLPEFPINVGLINKIPFIVNHIGDGKFKSVGTVEREIPNGCDEYLVPNELYVFDHSQLNELISNIIKDSLLTAHQNATVEMRESCSDHTPFMGTCSTCGSYHIDMIPTENVNKDSIINSFNQIYKNFKV